MGLTLRRARADDAMDTLAWRNDPHTVAMSRGQNIVNKDRHLVWFDKLLKDDKRILLIAQMNNQKVGLVRWDKTDDSHWEATYILAANARGLGYGKEMLKLGIEALKENIPANVPAYLVAEIRPENIPSKKIALAYGFIMRGINGEMEHYERTL